jgi:hypothetical protein
MPDTALANELHTFAAHKLELLAHAEGKFALVHDDEVVGVYDTENDAIAEGYRRFGNVPFLVKQVVQVEVPQRFVSNLLAL